MGYAILADASGVIHDCTDPIGKMIKSTGKKIIGKKIDNLFQQLTPPGISAPLINVIKNNLICPDGIYVRVLYKEFFSTLNKGIFLFSYSRPIALTNRQYFLIHLFPQTFNSPIVQRFLTLYRGFNIPVAVIEEDNRILMVNTAFSEALNFPHMSAILRKNIMELLDSTYHTSNPFSFRERNDYIQRIAESHGARWEPVVAVSRQETPCKTLFHTYKIAITNGRDKGFSARSDPASSMSYLASRKPFNTDSRDLRIEFTFIPGTGMDWAMALSHIFNETDGFDPAYHIDIKHKEGLTFQLCRRSVPVAAHSLNVRNTKKGINCVFERIGAFFSIIVCGKQVMTYCDPMPILDIRSRYLYFYAWKKDLTIEKLTISTRPSLFNMEKMEEHSPRLISFKLLPDVFFSYYLEPVNMLNRYCVAIYFKRIISPSKASNKNRTTALFQEAYNYINDNFRKKIDFKSLSKSCCVCVVHFIRKFKETYGATPKHHQMELRLKEAMGLIKTSGYAIREISEMVGFENEANFYKMFKKYFNKNPGEFR